ncbi:MAG: tetratricopeptide repeat protein, partial [Mariprofundus sp.]
MNICRQSKIIAVILFSLLLSACASNKHIEPDKREQLANIHYRIGIDALGKEGMLPKAFDELMESDAILPNQPEVLDALAYAWLLRGNMKKSEAYYLRAIRHGGGAATQNNYANLLNRLQRYPAAEKAARKSLDDPRYRNQDLAFINLGDALLGQKQFAEAITAYNQAQLFNPNSNIANLKLARAYFLHGKLREAGVLYKMLIRKQPNSRPAVEGLLHVLQQQNNTFAIRKVLRQFSQQSVSPMDKAWALNELDSIGLEHMKTDRIKTDRMKSGRS